MFMASTRPGMIRTHSSCETVLLLSTHESDSGRYLLSLGGLFAACMREDTAVLNNAAREREEQCGTSFICDASAETTGYSSVGGVCEF